MYKQLNCYLLLLAACGLVACAPTQVKKQRAFDFSTIGRIELQIIADDPSVLPVDLSEKVSKNLADWKYPIGAASGQAISHSLIAQVGAIEHANTPTGFSFSAGNSDPRAMDFQKTDVLPIDCKLTSIAHPEQTSDLSMGFTASKTDRRAFAVEKLADHISTVCFNLLREVKWPESGEKQESSTINPSWMPEIRIENKTVPAVTPKANEGAVKTNAEESPKTEDESEQRKEIIIHNQGSPVILHFGHERR